jgi:hypothetical protein
MGMNVDPSRHSASHHFSRQWLSDASSMVIYQVSLELHDLIIAKQDLRELADASIGTIHYFTH